MAAFKKGWQLLDFQMGIKLNFFQYPRLQPKKVTTLSCFVLVSFMSFIQYHFLGVENLTMRLKYLMN